MATNKVMILGIILASLCWAKDPVKGFQLKIVRDHGLPETLQIGDCISGKIYVEDPEHVLTGAGDVPLLEQPWSYPSEVIKTKSVRSQRDPILGRVRGR